MLSNHHASLMLATSSTQSISFIYLNQLYDLSVFDIVGVKIKVIHVDDPVTVSTGKTKREVIISDSTAISSITVWDNDINCFKEGACYQLDNVVIKSYKGKRPLSSNE